MRRFLRWRIDVLAGALACSVALLVLNNILNPNRVDWIGSPRVLEKPPGFGTPSWLEGIASGVAHAWEGLRQHVVMVLVITALALGGGWLLRRANLMGARAWAEILLRAGLAVMFLAAAWPKLADPGEFAMAVAQYRFLPGSLVHLFSLWMPAMELVAGVGLFFTRWTREFAALTGMLMAMFIVALSQALARELGIACGCFDISGAQDPAEAWFALLRDFVLVPPIAWLAWKGRECLPWQAEPPRPAQPEPRQRISAG